ncbi:MAG: hypothetical protein II625_10590 [Bacilli bacterium]|nr:hypothetical protein [Bacilli bacterium]
MKPTKRRKNKKILFDEDNYIEKYYYKNDKVVIPVLLEKISDLYMKHDFKQMELSYSVADYIEEIAYMVPVNIDLEIEIHCPKVNMATQKQIKDAIKNNYGMEIDELDYDRNVKNKRSLILFIVGIIILALYILVEKYANSTILSELFCIFWWVAIWNVIEIQTLEKREYKDERLNYQQLYEAKISFVFDQKTN